MLNPPSSTVLIHTPTLMLFLLLQTTVYGQWESPVGYYDSATGNGSVLKQQLESIMAAGHIERRYGDFRNSAAIHDQDPNNPNRIILVYNGNSVGSSWDSGNTWNREHVWPQSRQPGSASNSTRGNLGDPHALRPATPSVNSQRGNDPFGFGDTVGQFGPVGAYWFPGDVCKGDIARSLFYSATRWSSLGLSLTDSFPSGNQMGDLSSFVEWNFLDPPDEFERRRNHTIYSQAFNPDFYTNNRNAFVDRPEFVWSVFVDQENDSSIVIDGGTLGGNGESVLVLDYGKAIVNSSIDTNQLVTLNKEGLDGTYFNVETVDQAVCSVVGRYNAFRTNTMDSRTINVALDFAPSIPGIKEGMVVIDNLDVTTQGGDGSGANDVDDYIGLIHKVVEHSNASFNEGIDQNELTIDLGTLLQGQPIEPVAFAIFNRVSAAGADLTANLDFLSFDESPTDTFLTLSTSSFEGLAAGDFQSLSLLGSPTTIVGPTTTSFNLQLSDEAIPGTTLQVLTVNVVYEVAEGFALGDVNCDGSINLLDVGPFVEFLSSGTYDVKADLNQDGVVDLLDVDPLVEAIANGSLG